MNHNVTAQFGDGVRELSPNLSVIGPLLSCLAYEVDFDPGVGVGIKLTLQLGDFSCVADADRVVVDPKFVDIVGMGLCSFSTRCQCFLQ